ncbi:MAG: amidohydrolase [Myxococcales bacterium]|nr:amidohydrolase [Myxococcales bacterium]
MRSLLSSLLPLTCVVACGRSAPAAPDRATLVMVGGDVITNLPDRPRVTAVAVRGARVLAIGADADIRALAGPETRVIELHGRTVTVGLADGHCHLYGLGVASEQVNLRGLASESAAVVAVVAAAAGRPAGEWIEGRGWDQNPWGGAFPTRASLDAALGDRPVALRRVDGHAVWVSSAVLALAEITRATPDPAGGKIIRDAAGEPTGVLVDNAMALIEARAPKASPEARERRIRAAAAQAIAAGITAVHEMGIDDDTVAAYRRLAKAGELPLRVSAYLEGDPARADALAARAIEPDDGDDYFALVGVKYFADGALGSRGAALLADYSDDPGDRGLFVTAPDALDRAVAAATAAGWQVATHAIGDAGVHATLDAYEHAIKANPGQDLRLRVEHAQVMTDADIARMAALGVIASMQPTHATSDMPWAEARLGPERIKGAYAWRRVLDAGGLIVAGSDFPVEDVAPLGGIYAAVTRADAAGQPAGGWYPDQKLTLDEAIFAFTGAPAVAGFVEEQRGHLAPGLVADLTVYDRPLVAGRELLDTHVDLTVVGGEIVFERGAE